jgi:class 3 adenylate cyclase
LSKQYETFDTFDEIPNLTMLFADISGFTEYSSTATPEKVS